MAYYGALGTLVNFTSGNTRDAEHDKCRSNATVQFLPFRRPQECQGWRGCQERGVGCELECTNRVRDTQPVP